MAGTSPAMTENQSFSSGKIDAKACAETQARLLLLEREKAET